MKVEELLKDKKLLGAKKIVFSGNFKDKGSFTFEFSYKQLSSGFRKREVDEEGVEVKRKFTGEKRQMVFQRVEGKEPKGKVSSILIDELGGRQVKRLKERVLKPIKVVPKSIISEFYIEKTYKLWSSDKGSLLLAKGLKSDEAVACHFQPEKSAYLYWGFLYPLYLRPESPEDSLKLIWIIQAGLRKLSNRLLYPEAQAVEGLEDYEERLKEASSVLEAI